MPTRYNPPRTNEMYYDDRSNFDEDDSRSLASQMTTTTGLTSFAESLSTQLTRKTYKRGFTFNIMVVGPEGIGKTTLFSHLFNKNLEVPPREASSKNGFTREYSDQGIEVNTKKFDIEEKGVKLRLTVVDCQNYGSQLNLKNTYEPIVHYIDQQFAEYHKREFGHNRREIEDTVVHCLFFFISALGHGLNSLDIAFLKAVHEKVNIVPIIAKADALTLEERAAFKERIKGAFDSEKIEVYEIPNPDLSDDDDLKRTIMETKRAMPFAISSMTRIADNKLDLRTYDWGTIDISNREHSDYLHLANLLHLNMYDLQERTLEFFYEDYRVRMMKLRQDDETTSLRSIPASAIMTSSH